MTDATLPASEGGTPVRADFLPFAQPSIGQEEIDAVVDTLKSGWLTVGPRTRRFEEVVAEYIGVRGAAAVSSCSAGLHLAMVAFGVGSGDEVIMPVLNFAAAANMAIHLGARPVLVDVEPETLNVTAEILETGITRRTKLLIPIHFAGRPCEMEPILDLARSRNLKVLGDGAHAMGADNAGKKVGSAADATSFSFYVTKCVTTGEGGMVTSDDTSVTDKVAELSLHGMSRDAWKRYSDRGSWYYEIVDAGYKYNMSDIQAAIGLCQMRRIDELRNARDRIAHAYDEAFRDLSGVVVPTLRVNGHHAHHLYPIKVDPAILGVPRGAFIDSLKAEGIGVSVHFIPLHLHPFFRRHLGYAAGEFPITESYYERAISLPIYPAMTTKDVSDVIEAVTKLHNHYAR